MDNVGGPSIGGRMSQRFVWDPGIKGSIHDGMAWRYDVTQRFIWDPGIHM